MPNTAVEELKKHFDNAIVNEDNFLGETTLETHKDFLKEILKFLKEECGFKVLMDLTGIDYIKPEKKTKVLYWLHHPTSLQRLRIIVFVERNGSLPSVVDLWRGADWYERELFDLFGINFEGHPAMRRILMPDDWIGHPLLKDYALTEESVEFKHGVKPKIPSEIIPNVKGPRLFNPFGSYEKH